MVISIISMSPVLIVQAADCVQDGRLGPGVHHTLPHFASGQLTQYTSTEYIIL